MKNNRDIGIAQTVHRRIWSYNAFLLEKIYYRLKQNKDGHIFRARTMSQALSQNYGPKELHLIIRPS